MQETGQNNQHTDPTVEEFLAWVREKPGPLVQERLRILAERYPYSDLVQVLYLRSLKGQDDEEFERQLRKTAILVRSRERLLRILQEDELFEDAVQKGVPSSDRDQLLEQFLKKRPRIVPNSATHEEAEQIAEDSVREDPGNVSETLARIYAMQGKKEKARQMYEKLSLKYPEKSAYFAAQIEKIKSNSNI